MVFTGMSGFGKTTLLQKTEINLAKQGNTVIVINLHSTHDKSQVFPVIREEYGALCKWTDVQADGVPLGLLSPIKMGLSISEKEETVVNALLNAFGGIKRLGYRQKAALRTAITHAMRNPYASENDLEAIANSLSEQENADANAVLDNFYEVFAAGKFFRSSSFAQSGYINILDLSGFDVATQEAMAELVIAVIWRYMRVMGLQAVKDVCLVLDEFQTLNLGKRSTLAQILQEGRKFHLALLLSTQTMSTIAKDRRALVEQAAIKIYFRQTYADGVSLSKRLDVNRWKEWCQILTTLPVGNYLVDGELEIAGYHMKQPIVLH